MLKTLWNHSLYFKVSIQPKGKCNLFHVCKLENKEVYFRWKKTSKDGGLIKHLSEQKTESRPILKSTGLEVRDWEIFWHKQTDLAPI